VSAGFRLLAHTADLGIESWGPDFAGALAQAVSALGVVLAGEGAGQATEERPVRLVAEDEAALVVALLQEALFLLEVEGWLSVDAALRVDPAGVLTGHLLGEPFDAVRHADGEAVKAVTWHGLAVDREPGRVSLTIYLDL
jgi:SHS2 domain-containing protein